MDARELAETSDSMRAWLLRELDARREQLGLAKTEMASRAGLSRMSVQRATADDADPQLSTFVQLALAVNLQPRLVNPGAELPVAPQDVVHRGLAYSRTLATQEGKDRVREAAFAAAWEQVNEHQDVGLTALLPSLVPGHSQEQATAAATVIQWLGSEVGFDFLKRTLASVGYEIREKR